MTYLLYKFTWFVGGLDKAQLSVTYYKIVRRKLSFYVISLKGKKALTVVLYKFIRYYDRDLGKKFLIPGDGEKRTLH